MKIHWVEISRHTIYSTSECLSSYTRRRITEIKFRYQFHVGINLFGWVYQQCRLLVAARIPNDNNNANVWNKYKSNANITKWTYLHSYVLTIRVVYVGKTNSYMHVAMVAAAAGSTSHSKIAAVQPHSVVRAFKLIFLFAERNETKIGRCGFPFLLLR